MSFAMTTRSIARCAAPNMRSAKPAFARNVRPARSIVSTSALFGFMQKEATGGIYDVQVKGPGGALHLTGGTLLQDIDGKFIKMSQYAGKVVLVVNVASECGMTPQYAELASLYDKYKSDGLVILGAPCNQFGSQEPKSNKEIKQFAQSKGAKFQMLSKIDVNGPNTDPLYSYLKEAKPGLFGTKDIKWNFTKMLIDKEGNVVGRYGPSTVPTAIEDDILKLLNQ